MKMKRFVAVFVSVMMVLGTMAAVPAFASSSSISTADTAIVEPVGDVCRNVTKNDTIRFSIKITSEGFTDVESLSYTDGGITVKDLDGTVLNSASYTVSGTAEVNKNSVEVKNILGFKPNDESFVEGEVYICDVSFTINSVVYAYTYYIGINVTPQLQASVGNAYYLTLADAVAAAQNGDTITLLSDVTEGTAGEVIVYDISGCTLDLNGFTYTAPNFVRIFQGSNATIKNGKMVCADGGSYALFVGDEGTTDNFTVENVELSGGVNVYNASNVVLKNLRVVGTNYYAVWADENAFVTIESGTYNAGNVALFNVALMEDEESDTDIPSVITVKGGMFNANDKPIYGGSGGILSVSGGTFTSDVSDYVATGFKAINNGNGTWSVVDENVQPVAKIGDTDYYNFEYAVNSVQNGQTVTLLSDVVLSNDLKLGTGNIGFDLNLNGHTIDGEQYQVYTAGNGTINIYGGTIKNYNSSPGTSGAALYISSGSNVKLGNVNISGNYVAIANYGNLTINTANITGTTFGVGCFGNGSTVFGAENADNSGIIVKAKEQAIATAAAYTNTGNSITVYGGTYTTAGAVWDDCPVYGAGHGVINIKGGKFVATDKTQTCGIYVKNGTVNIENGEFDAKDGIKIGVETGDTTSVNVNVSGGVFKGVRSGIYAKSTAAGSKCTEYNINVSGGTFTGGTDKGAEYLSFAGMKPKLVYTGGTFNSTITDDYIASGHYLKDNGDGTYTVLPAEAKVIDTAKTTGATVTLDNLNKNTAVDPAADATYKVVVETAPKADADAANAKIAERGDTNKSKAMFDISVVKTDSNGTETVLNNVTDQKVTLTLGETPTGTVHVYHVVGNSVTEITPVTVSGNTVTFTATSFSTYAVTYNAAPLSNSEIAKEVGVVFERVGDTNEYDIVLKGKDNLKLNRFMSADLTFDMEVTDGAVGYTIKPSTNINIVDNGNGRYEFNLDGLNASGATGAEVPIGKVIFEGNGTVEFSVKTEGVTTNIVNTAKSANNIVDDYIPGGRMVEHQQVGILKLENKINATFTAPTKDLTVNIAYNNAISDQLATYQDMSVTISGGDLTTPIVKHLGSEEYTLNDNVYTVTVADKLTQNVAYTVTVEGAGYRTARHTVTMTANKTLNFWNNVLDTVSAKEIEEGKGTVTKNFLAGDIVKDNNINIYDLSAVVSYFGTSNNVNAASAYARYDLNRDGKIDSKDVAYVLVSWNN